MESCMGHGTHALDQYCQEENMRPISATHSDSYPLHIMSIPSDRRLADSCGGWKSNSTKRRRSSILRFRCLRAVSRIAGAAQTSKLVSSSRGQETRHLRDTITFPTCARNSVSSTSTMSGRPYFVMIFPWVPCGTSFPSPGTYVCALRISRALAESLTRDGCTLHMLYRLL